MKQFGSRKLGSGWISVKWDYASLSQHSQLAATQLSISCENINLDLLDMRADVAGEIPCRAPIRILE